MKEGIGMIAAAFSGEYFREKVYFSMPVCYYVFVGGLYYFNVTARSRYHEQIHRIHHACRSRTVFLGQESPNNAAGSQRAFRYGSHSGHSCLPCTGVLRLPDASSFLQNIMKGGLSWE